MTNYKNIFIFVAFCLININCVNENVTKESFIKNILDKMTLEEDMAMMNARKEEERKEKRSKIDHTTETKVPTNPRLQFEDRLHIKTKVKQ